MVGASRWYPKTLHDRILAIGYVKNKIDFISGDAFEAIEQSKENENAYFFIDPPYTIAGKRLNGGKKATAANSFLQVLERLRAFTCFWGMKSGSCIRLISILGYKYSHMLKVKEFI